MVFCYCTFLHGGAVANEVANGSPTGDVAEAQAASVKSTFSCFFTTYTTVLFSYCSYLLYCTVLMYSITCCRFLVMRDFVLSRSRKYCN